MSEFNVGDKVVRIGKDPNFQTAPEEGTVGTITRVDLTDNTVHVNTEAGIWWCSMCAVKKIPDFKVGDRVEVIKPWCSAKVGDVGVIKWGFNGKYSVEFERKSEGFHDCEGHTKDYHGHWMLDEHLKLLDDKEEIVITHDGKTVTAKLTKNGETVKTSNARCHPDDEFDFGIGAKLAVERLTTTEPKFKVGDKVIGNDLANEYVITKKGWIGTVTEVIPNRNQIRIKSLLDKLGYLVDAEAFDLYTEPEYFTGDVVCVEAKKDLHFTVGKIYHIDNGLMETRYLKVRKVTSIDDLNARFNTARFIELVK